MLKAIYMLTLLLNLIKESITLDSTDLTIVNNSEVNFTSLLFFAPDYVLPNKTCQSVSMLSERGRLHESWGFFWFLWEWQYARGRQLYGRYLLLSYISISFVFVVGADAHIHPIPRTERDDVGIVPYNNFTNYDAIICKRGRFILQNTTINRKQMNCSCLYRTPLLGATLHKKVTGRSSVIFRLTQKKIKVNCLILDALVLPLYSA